MPDWQPFLSTAIRSLPLIQDGQVSVLKNECAIFYPRPTNVDGRRHVESAIVV